jgi:hypothetical protein
MSKWIYKKEILSLIENQKFNSEKEFEEFITPRLVELFKIKPSQIDNQSITTSFDYTLSNCADIVIRSDDSDIKKALLVIELKLTKSIDKFKNGNYTDAVKQLHKYCQDVKTNYGILLTEETCFVYYYDYVKKDQESIRIETDRIPNMKIIEDRATKDALVDFIVRKGSFKHLCFLLLAVFAIGLPVYLILCVVFRVFLGK